MTAPNTYSFSADLYDLDTRELHSADIPFFVNHAKQAAGPVLELACGTGRITIPIAQAGQAIYGLDLSPTMLDRFRIKIEKLPTEIAARIHLHQGDMTAFSLAERFGLIFIPFRSFQALTTRAQQLSCLQCVRSHLKKEGRFIVNVFRPYAQLDQSWEKPPQLDWETIDPRSGKKVSRHHCRKKIDVQKQLLDIEMIFSIEGEPEIIDPLRLTYFYPEQVESLLREAGFTIVESMGDYDGKPLGEGGELIYVCEKHAE